MKFNDQCTYFKLSMNTFFSQFICFRKKFCDIIINTCKYMYTYYIIYILCIILNYVLYKFFNIFDCFILSQ